MNNENMQSSSAMNMGMDDSSQGTGASASGSRAAWPVASRRWRPRLAKS